MSKNGSCIGKSVSFPNTLHITWCPIWNNEYSLYFCRWKGAAKLEINFWPWDHINTSRYLVLKNKLLIFLQLWLSTLIASGDRIYSVHTKSVFVWTEKNLTPGERQTDYKKHSYLNTTIPQILYQVFFSKLKNQITIWKIQHTGEKASLDRCG